MFGSKKKDTSQSAEKKISFFDRGIAALKVTKDQITGTTKKKVEDTEKPLGVVVPKGGAKKKAAKKSPLKEDTHFAIGGFGSDDEDEDENIAVKDQSMEEQAAAHQVAGAEVMSGSSEEEGDAEG